MRRITKRILSVIITLMAVMVTALAGSAARIAYADELNDKKPLTNGMLAQEYASHHSETLIVGNLILWVMIAFLIGCIGIVVYYFIKFKRSGGDHTRGKIFLLVIFVPVIGSLALATVLLAWGMTFNPDPEDASYSVEIKRVLRKEREAHSSGGEDNTTTYYYYAYLEDDRRMSGESRMLLSEAEYNRISAPGDYYVAIASAGKKNSEFALYSVDEYEPASDVTVIE